MSDGPPRYRLNSPNYTSLFNVQWLLTEQQFQTFRLWYEGFAGVNQNRWFTIALAVGRASTLTTGSPRFLQSLEAHFYEDWEASLDTGTNSWILSAILETRYAPIIVGLEQLIISAGLVTDPFPVDIIDAGLTTDPFPTDIINAGGPTTWQ